MDPLVSLLSTHQDSKEGKQLATGPAHLVGPTADDTDATVILESSLQSQTCYTHIMLVTTSHDNTLYLGPFHVV